MHCRYCLGERVVWRRPMGRQAYTYCRDCGRRNSEERTNALPHGAEECARAQLLLKV